ncbi:MAG TPA: M3 family metallopeptidase [Bryobacteraceae bacterium]|nr:M3 family metallopeptidase [Bryobacteraceae bacterium]
MPTSNPLTEIRFPIPFDQIRAEHVEPAIDQLLAEARSAQQELGLPKERTFENTMLALENVTEKLGYAMGVIAHLEAVSTYPELRAAYNKVQPLVSEFFTGLLLDEKIWRALKDYEETPEVQTLSPTKRRFVRKTIDDFRRHGAELGHEHKKRLAEIDIELTQITTKFSENVLDATNEFELVLTDPAALAGLPESAIEQARHSAQNKGLEGWRFTLHAPSYIAVMTYLDDRGTRRLLHSAFNTRGAKPAHDNRPILGRILELRREKAALLGYDNFADLVLEDRMAKSGKAAQNFLEELKQRTVARFKAENEELQKFRDELEGNHEPLQLWDIDYYVNKLRKKQYDFDEEAIRPYFPLSRVVEGMFDLVHRLYGIRVEEQQGAPVWDPAVKFYRLLDSDGTHLGSFYADWHPRENKRGGAWMDAFITGRPTPEGFEPHLGLICGNLTPPVGSKPALLKHREVETIFHEFGHLLHHLLSQVEIRSLSGTQVAWDFVELPSQIMENWCWERESLDLFARHWETGEPIPDSIFLPLKRTRTFRAANAQMRQLGFALLDLALHIEYDPSRHGELIEFSRNFAREFVPAPLTPEYAMIAAFSHLFGSPVGYGAGYYSYKWAEVLDADAFTRFALEGIFNSETGKAFRASILSKGNSEDPSELYRQFMGRDPDVSALLARSGLA